MDEKKTTLTFSASELELIAAGLYKVRDLLPPGNEDRHTQATKLIARLYKARERVAWRNAS